MADAGPFAIVVFDPDGRGRSVGIADAPGEEDDGGFVHRDGLATVIHYVAELPEIDGARVALSSVSYGVTMAAGALVRYPDLPILFLIDREGPANRDDTGGCDAADTGHLKAHACDDETFWVEREAATFARSLQVPYQRLQSRADHVQPDLAHAVLMLANTTAQAYGGEGVAPWTRLNGLAPNRVYTEATLPELPPPGSPVVLDAVAYARELFELFGPVPSTGSGTGAPASAAAPLYFTTMTHMEGSFVDDRDYAVFDVHVAQLRYGLALANEYGAKFTVESEMPFARACATWGLNMMQEVLDLGHGVGTHADVGFNNPPPNVTVLTQELRHRKVLVDALVGQANNRGVSGAGGVNDWVLAANQAGFGYVDGVVGMHYLAMPLAARPDASRTIEYIRTTTFHDPAPVDFATRPEV